MSQPNTARSAARTVQRILFFGIVASAILVAGLALTGPPDPSTPLASRLMCWAALTAGLLSIILGDKESNGRYRVLLLLLSFWLVWTGLQEIVQNVFVRWFSVAAEKSFYAVEFNHIMWTLTGLLLASFIAVDSFSDRLVLGLKWALALVLALIVWGALWVPVLGDPEMLYKEPLVKDFVVIDEYLTTQADAGRGQLDASTIAREVSLRDWEGGEQGVLLRTDQNLSRIKEVLAYMEGPQDYVMMLLRPLNARDGWAGLFCVVMLGVSSGIKMFRDRPESAYVEKIIFFLFFIWVFETFHAFSFSVLRSMDVFRVAYGTGFVISALLFLLLGFLLSRRIDFVVSIEGRYYERVLLRDASSVTRWIDHFDEFILKRFFHRGGSSKRLFTLRDK